MLAHSAMDTFKRRLVTGLTLVCFGFCTAFAAPPATDEPSQEITLAEAVQLALRSNRTVKSSYLDRVVQKFDLKVARDQFSPDVDLDASAGYTGSETQTQGSSDATTSDLSLASTLTAKQEFKTGGTLTFSWARNDSLADTNSSAENRTGANTWTVKFTHPLLKGAGVDVNTATLTLAELSEQSNLLSHRDTISATVNATIRAFRAYAQRARQNAIIQASLERSQAHLEMNRLLIELGRMPANEIIQSESNLANQEFAHETALNDLDNARLGLLKVLDLPRGTRLTPLEETDLPTVHPDPDRCLKTAFRNRADFINARMALERAQIQLLLAQDNQKWDLDFTSQLSAGDTEQRTAADTETYNWNIGLRLAVPLYGDLTREQTLLSARTGLKKAELALEEIKQNITLEVQDAIRVVEIRLKQVGMAKRSRELSAKKLSVEQEKLKVGRTTTFQLVSFQNELVDSQNAEVNARVDYLNSLTDLDTILGTTVKTWQIDYNKENDAWPGK